MHGRARRNTVVAGVVAACAVTALAVPGNAYAAKKLSIDDVVVTEPDAGATTKAVFTISLTRKATKAVKVDYTTAPGTATADEDYISKAGTARVAKGKRRKKLSIRVNGDDVFEGDEMYQVEMSNPRRASIRDGLGEGTIDDNDPEPDSDADGIPNSQDPCPDFAEPQGYCPATPYDITSGTVGPGFKAIVQDAIVTATAPDGRAWVAFQDGDPGFISAPGSAIEVDLTGVDPTPSVAIGDRVDVRGTVVANGDLGADSLNPDSTGNPVVVNDVTLAQLDGPMDSVLVRVTDALTLESTSTGGWQMAEDVLVSDAILGTLPDYAAGKTFTSITGIAVTVGVTPDRVIPRQLADIVPGPPLLVGFELTDDCVDVGTTGAVVGMVVLDDPAAQDTFVAVTSDDPTTLAAPAGGGVTVLEGQTTAQVPVDAIQEGAAELTASLDGREFAQTVAVGAPCAT